MKRGYSSLRIVKFWFVLLLLYHFGLENSKGILKKVDLLESLSDFLESIGKVLRRGEGGGYVVTNEGVCKSGEERG